MTGDGFPAPAPRDRPVQLIDVRDAAAFAVLSAKDGLSGPWNVTGEPRGFAEVLAAIIAVSGSDAEPVWVTEDAIREADLSPWVDIPLMAPLLPAFRHFLDVGTGKARSAGLICRPLEETLRPLLDWDRGRRHRALKVGMTRDQEARLIG